MPYTLRNLIEELTEAAEEYGEDIPVRIALTQTHGNLQFEIQCTTVLGVFGESTIMWLATGEHPYGESPYVAQEATSGEDAVTDADNIIRPPTDTWSIDRHH